MIIDKLPILRERIIPFPEDSRVKVTLNPAEFTIKWAPLTAVPVTSKRIMCGNNVETIEVHLR